MNNYSVYKHLKVTKNITNLRKKWCEFPPRFFFENRILENYIFFTYFSQKATSEATARISTVKMNFMMSICNEKYVMLDFVDVHKVLEQCFSTFWGSQHPLRQACTTYGPRAKCGQRKLLILPAKPIFMFIRLDFWWKHYKNLKKINQSGPRKFQ